MNEKLKTPLALKNISNTPHLANKNKTVKNQLQSKKIEFEKEQQSDSEDEIIDHSQCGFEEKEIPVREIKFAEEEILEESNQFVDEVVDIWKDLPELKFDVICDRDIENEIRIRNWLDEGLFYSEIN